MKYALLILAVVAVSCKSKMPKAEKKALAIVEHAVPDTTQIKGDYFAHPLAFSTAYIKCNAHYETDKQSQNVTAEIKIKKDEKIIISIRFLGITMAKALITPTQVQYYEKLNSSYFDGNFEAISQFVGADLNFQKLQNVLIGQAIEAFPAEACKITIEQNWVKVEKDNGSAAFITYFFDAVNSRLQKQVIQQQAQERLLTVTYPKFASYTNLILPANIVVNALQKEAKMNLSVEYTDVTVNEELSFPYAVPEGYKRIIIN